MAVESFTKPTKTDAALISGIRMGEESAMAVLFERYSSLVFCVALKTLHNREEAEDVMQEVFLRVWCKPECYAIERGAFRSWICVMTRNRAIDTMRRRRTKEQDLIENLQSETNVERTVIDCLEVERVRIALIGLSKKQRQTFELAFTQDLSYPEIASLRDEPLSTVKSRLRLTLRILRQAVAVGGSRADNQSGVPI